MINPDDLALAREWAEEMETLGHSIPMTLNAVRVIQALPDTIVDGAKVRELADQWENDLMDASDRKPYWQGYDAATIQNAEELRALLLTPPRKPAMIKRGATAWHDELGEVTILSNKPNRGAGLAAVTDLVRVAADWDEGDDGSQVATVNASSLTAPDEGLVDSGAPETNNDSADDEEVDDYRVEPSLGVTHNDWWGASRPMTQADVVRADGAPVEPTRSFPTGAHYDSEGNATEPEDVPAGEAWLIEFEGQRHHAVRCWVGINIVYMFWTGNGRWTQINANYEDVAPVAPLVPKPEPRVLTTLEDYQDAAIGTVVRIDHPAAHFSLWGKRHGNLWQSTAGYKQDNDEMSDVARMVIWAPKEAEK